MGMPQIRFSCTALVGTNKKGIIKPDSNGYREQCLSALDYPNSIGQTYRTSSARRILEESSSFSRKIKAGNLLGEDGHPRWEPGMTKKQYEDRIFDVFEPNVSHHTSDVWIDDSGACKDASGKPFIAIMGLVKPDRAKGPLLEAAYSNPKQNVCFSVRSVTDNFLTSRGTIEKEFTSIICWDWVNEPGLTPATKFGSVSLEDRMITLSSLEDMLHQAETSRISMESAKMRHIYEADKNIRMGRGLDSDIRTLKWLNW